MQVAILKCDDVLEQLQSEFGAYTDMIKQMFETAQDSFEFESFDCQRGEYPENIHSFDFYITTGSRAGVYENKPWIQKLIQFIQLLDSQQIKLIGICFGHQIMAIARGGTVEKSAKGWGVGVAKNKIVATPGWMTPPKSLLNIIVSHKDQVTLIPEDAQVLAGTEFCPYFLVQWNHHFLSTQGHPEWDTDYSKALMNQRRAIIPVETVESAFNSLKTPLDNALFTRWILQFVNY